jgi:hypothetical protein
LGKGYGLKCGAIENTVRERIENLRNFLRKRLDKLRNIIENRWEQNGIMIQIQEF